MGISRQWQPKCVRLLFCKENAERWIQKHALSGLLTAYPVDNPVYE
ncbi:DUF7710 domain-containing protein [Eikenella longinqua]